MDSTAIVIIVIVLVVLIAGIAIFLSRRTTSGGSAPAAPPPPQRRDQTPTGTYPTAPGSATPPGTVDRAGKRLFEDEPTQIPSPPPAAGTPAPPAPPPQSAPSPVSPAPVAAPQPAQPSAPPEPAPAIPTEDVRFTVFHPKEVAVERWYTLLTYAHIEAALAQVQADAARFKEDMGGNPRQAQSSAPAQLARGTEITVLPQMDGVEFNPERITFKWVEDLHRAEFRMRAAKPLAGLAGNGTVSILVGPVIVATIKIGMLFDDEDSTLPLKDVAPAQATASIYQAEKIFISYSHKDTPVATACRAVYKALGYDVLIDVDKLRSGENWTEALMRLIDNADIFQLFWSQNSAQSNFCRKEWQYALEQEKLKGNAFIRPVYWEQPLVPPPDELEPLHFAYVALPKSSVDDNVH